MSTTRRIVSGSLAGWTRMGTVLITQLATVPIYLSQWGVELYGLWLLLHSAVLMLPILDAAHHQYLDGEFLKTGDEDKLRLNEIFWGGLGVSVFVGGVQFLGTMGVIGLLYAGYMPIEDRTLIESNLFTISIFLGVYAFLWWCMGSTGGILVRYLYPLGFYPRIAWWFVGVTLLESIVPALIVWFGGSLLAATLAFLATFVVIRSSLLIDSLLIAIRSGLRPCTIPWTQAWTRLARSMLLAIQQGTDSLRQQGMRLILSPMAGTIEMTHFSTVRVGVNAVSQGFTAISTPLMPELMRFVRLRDQAKIEASFATLWALVLGVVIPGCVFLQFVAADMIFYWTGGKIPFDPVVFAILTLGSIFFAISQPAWVLVRANNLLKAQLVISVVAAGILLTSMFLTIPVHGIRGAAFAACVTELFCLVAIALVASSWLSANGLRYPYTQFGLLLLAVLLAAFAYGAAANLSNRWAIPISSVALLLYGWLTVLYWKQLPIIGRQRVVALLNRIRNRTEPT